MYPPRPDTSPTPTIIWIHLVLPFEILFLDLPHCKSAWYTGKGSAGDLVDIHTTKLC